MKRIIASLLTLFAAASTIAEQRTIDYRFDDVKHKVLLTTPKTQLQVAKGNRAESGDKVSTGWFSYALIASDRYRAKFEIFSSTDVQLAGGQPGVILSVERGRLRAMFDKLTGDEPRVVKTPGALLAVRGTKYEVNVGTTGDTDLRVYEGTVEVRSALRPAPLFVHAGEMATYGRQQPPQARPMPHGEMERGGHEGEPNEHGPDAGRDHGPQQPGQGPHGMMPPPTAPPTSGKHH